MEQIATENAHRIVWRLAGPLILSNLTIPLLGAVDTAVVGQLPDPVYIGGVAIGGIIFNYLYWGFGFLRMGTTGLTAQAAGAGDVDEVRASLVRAGVLSGSIAVALLLLQGVIGRIAFALLEASPAVEAQARLYFHVRIWGAPAALMNYAILGWLFGVQRTRAALVFQLVQNGVNILLDLLFVLQFGWGVGGVAAATAISQYVGVGVGLAYVGGTLKRLGGRWRRDLALDRKRIRTLVGVNRDIFLRTLALITGFAYFTQRGATMGDVTLAANAVLLNFQNFQAYGLDAFAHAAEILAGNAAGTRNRRTFSRAVRVTTIWAVGIAAVAALVFLVFGKGMVRLMTASPEVRIAAYAVLPWAVVSPLVSVWSYQLDGIFIGTTRAREMRNAMWLSLALFVVVENLLRPAMGNHGLWLALMLFMATRAVTLGSAYPKILRAIESEPPTR